MTSIPESENRFHALKFAAQTHAHLPGEVLNAAEAYLRFLNGEPSAELIAAEREANPMLTVSDAGDVELADLTESYPAEEPEPVVAVADSPEDHWELATASLEAENELFEAEGIQAAVDAVNAEENPNYGAFDEVNGTGFGEFLKTLPAQAEAASKHIEAAYAEPEPEPTFEYVAEAVEQIAGSPPTEPDQSEAPEMTDEQVERLEEQTREALAQDIEDRELEPVGDGPRPRTRWNPFTGF